MVIDYCEELEELKKYVVARQLLRCGTAIGANAMEAQNSESRADFIPYHAKDLCSRTFKSPGRSKSHRNRITEYKNTV